VPTNAAPTWSSAAVPSRCSTRAEIRAFSSAAARSVKVNAMIDHRYVVPADDHEEAHRRVIAGLVRKSSTYGSLTICLSTSLL
jgi:hypothetical protein